MYLARGYWQATVTETPTANHWAYADAVSYAMLGNRTRTRLESATSWAQPSSVISIWSPAAPPPRSPVQLSGSFSRCCVWSAVSARARALPATAPAPAPAPCKVCLKARVADTSDICIYAHTQAHNHMYIHIHIHMLTFDVFHFFFRFHSLRDLKTFK